MKIKSFIIAVLATSFIMGCTKKLDINPEQSLSEEVALSSQATAQSVLLGVYSSAQSLDAFGAMPQIVGDYQADNVDFVGSFPTLQEINLFTTLSTNGNVEGWWLAYYRIILRANTIMDKVPGISQTGFTDAIKNQMVAEAKFLRALAYFQLVNLFAQPYQISKGSNLGVPLVTKSFTGTPDFPGRATVNEIHAQIIKDLTEALPNLPVTYPSPSDTRGRATNAAAKALLSRLYLYRGDWSNAADFANQVINISTNYSLSGSYNFGRNTAEDIFSIQMTATDNSRTGAGGWASYYRPAALGGRGDCPMTADLINAFQQEPGDKRFALNDLGVASDGNTKRFTLKYPDAVNNTDNSPLIRLAEMYLNRAEALAQKDGINQTSVDLINALRRRAGLSDLLLINFLTQQSLVDAILNERRKELCFEGHRRMDLLRNGKSLRTGSLAAAAAPGAARTIMPIPQREIDNNSGLKGQQNPGY